MYIGTGNFSHTYTNDFEERKRIITEKRPILILYLVGCGEAQLFLVEPVVLCLPSNSTWLLVWNAKNDCDWHLATITRNSPNC